MSIHKLHHIFPQTVSEDRYAQASSLSLRVCNYLDDQDKRFIYNAHTLPIFKDLVSWIDECVNNHTKFLKYPKEYKCTDSWLHDYEINTYQPWHTQAGNIISCVYMICANPKVASPLYFKNPVVDMMNPHEATMSPDYKGYETNEYNSEQMAYSSVTGTLFTFRSHLEHAMTQKTHDDRRIILALNYNP